MVKRHFIWIWRRITHVTYVAIHSHTHTHTHTHIHTHTHTRRLTDIEELPGVVDTELRVLEDEGDVNLSWSGTEWSLHCYGVGTQHLQSGESREREREREREGERGREGEMVELYSLRCLMVVILYVGIAGLR